MSEKQNKKFGSDEHPGGWEQSTSLHVYAHCPRFVPRVLHMSDRSHFLQGRREGPTFAHGCFCGMRGEDSLSVPCGRVLGTCLRGNTNSHVLTRFTFFASDSNALVGLSQLIAGCMCQGLM